MFIFPRRKNFFRHFWKVPRKGEWGSGHPLRISRRGGSQPPTATLSPQEETESETTTTYLITEGLPIYPCAFVDTMAPGQGVDAGGQGVRPDDDAHPDAVDGPHGDLVGAVRRTWRISKHTCAVCWLWFCHCGCFCWHAVHGHPIGEPCR